MRTCAFFPKAVGGVVGALALVAHLAMVAPARAADPSETYLATRRDFPPRVGVTVTLLGKTPESYRGVTAEVEGRLVGIARGGGGASLMLATETDGTVTLPLKDVPSWLQAGDRLRALVTVSGADAATGYRELEVIALASASDIVALEQRLKAEAAARATAKQEAKKSGKRPARPLADQISSLGIEKREAFVPQRASSPRPSLDARAAVASRSLSPNAQAVYEPYRAAIRGFNRNLSEREVDTITSSILHYSERLDVDPRLVIAVIIAESSFNPGATSRTGAMGLGQIMPGTAREIGLQNPYDLSENIYGAVYLLKQRLQKYSGGAPQALLQSKHIILALAAYNAGMGAVKKYGGVPPYRETQAYVKKVERIYRQLCGEATT